MDLHAEGGRGLTEDVPQVRLPRGLSQRILQVVMEEALGYTDFDGFVLAAIRRELRQAERASYWMRRAEDR